MGEVAGMGFRAESGLAYFFGREVFQCVAARLLYFRMPRMAFSCLQCNTILHFRGGFTLRKGLNIYLKYKESNILYY